MRPIAAMTVAAILGIAGTLFAVSNIDNTVPDKFAWCENVGWSDWRDANAAADGVNVNGFAVRDSHLFLNRGGHSRTFINDPNSGTASKTMKPDSPDLALRTAPPQIPPPPPRISRPSAC